MEKKMRAWNLPKKKTKRKGRRLRKVVPLKAMRVEYGRAKVDWSKFEGAPTMNQ